MDDVGIEPRSFFFTDVVELDRLLWAICASRSFQNMGKGVAFRPKDCHNVFCPSHT